MAHVVKASDVTVVMPVRNGLQFAPRSLQRLLIIAKGMEVLIVDDGSTDGSFEYCKNFCAQLSNFIVFKNPGSGISQALDFGIKQASGTWIARVDIDDEYDSQRIFDQIDLVNQSQCILTFSDYSFHANGIRKMGCIPSGILSNPVKLSLISGRRTPHPSAFFRKDIYIKAGGYLPEDSPAEDLSLWLRMQTLGDFGSSNTELLRYRLAHSSTTMQLRTISSNKRRELLKKYPIGIEVFNESIKDLQSTLNSYKQIERNNERIILHILDIYLYARMYKIRIPLTTIIVILKHFTSIRCIFSGAQLFIRAFERSIFRSIKVPNSWRYRKEGAIG